MNNQEFKEIITPKLLFIGVRDDEMRTWYEVLIKYDATEIHNAIMAYVEFDEGKYRVKIATILKYRKTTKEKAIIEKVPCNKCKSKGFIIAICTNKKGELEESINRCTCGNGESYSSYPKPKGYYKKENEKYFISEQAYKSYKEFEKEILSRPTENKEFVLKR